MAYDIQEVPWNANVCMDWHKPKIFLGRCHNAKSGGSQSHADGSEDVPREDQTLGATSSIAIGGKGIIENFRATASQRWLQMLLGEFEKVQVHRACRSYKGKSDLAAYA